MEEIYQKRGYLLEDFRLFHVRDAEGPRIEYHYHEFHKILLLLSGNGSYVIEGRRYLLQPGDVVLVGNGRVHRPEFGGGSPYERVILYISPDYLRREGGDASLEHCFFGENPVLRLEDSARVRLFSLVAEMEAELSGNAYGRELLSSCLLLRLVVEISRGLRDEASLLPRPAEPKDAKILDILHYLNDHLTEEISIDALANRFFISKYHMMRRFREETGSPIYAYLSDMRLLHARDLIANGMPATQACYRAGFKSYSSFTRAYAKLFHATPTGRKSAPPRENPYE